MFASRDYSFQIICLKKNGKMAPCVDDEMNNQQLTHA